MRQIKFRAWDIENKQMDSWEEIQGMWETEGYRCDGVLGYDHWIPMQYTGKKDCNGNEIYEGDIIEFDKKEWGGNDNIHLVEWDDKNAEWSWGGGCTGDMGWRTVIGNIYENPELIPQT